MLKILPKGKLARKEAIWSYIFMSPWLIGFLVFIGGPIIVSLYLSFTRYNVASPPRWLGIENYADMFGDRIFYKSLQVSAYYTALSVPLATMPVSVSFRYLVLLAESSSVLIVTSRSHIIFSAIAW